MSSNTRNSGGVDAVTEGKRKNSVLTVNICLIVIAALGIPYIGDFDEGAVWFLSKCWLVIYGISASLFGHEHTTQEIIESSMGTLMFLTYVGALVLAFYANRQNR